MRTPDRCHETVIARAKMRGRRGRHIHPDAEAQTGHDEATPLCGNWADLAGVDYCAAYTFRRHRKIVHGIPLRRAESMRHAKEIIKDEVDQLRKEAVMLQKMEDAYPRWITRALKRAQSAHRKGPNPLRGTISADELREAFGMHTVAVSANVPTATRDTILSRSAQGIVDLGAALGISPQKVFMGGRLGLAVGSRGPSSSCLNASCYNHRKGIVHLSIQNGWAGVFAHQWFHALDCAAAERYPLAHKSDHAPTFVGRYWRPEILRNSKPQDLASVALELCTVCEQETRLIDRAFGAIAVRPSWRIGGISVEEVLARAFEGHVVHKLAKLGIHNPFLAVPPTRKDVPSEGIWLGVNMLPTPEESARLEELFDTFLARALPALEI